VGKSYSRDYYSVMASAPEQVPPGIGSLSGLQEWLGDTVEEIRLIAGGRSNLTYYLRAGDRTLVLRRPPLGHVLPTAHDMAREFRVISALHGTDVPVAEPIAYCPDETVIGAPFYLMGYVPGQVVRTHEQAEEALTPEQAGQLSGELATMMARIHTVDVDAVGLSTLGRGKGFMQRQLDRWQKQWALSQTRHVPGYDELVDRLTRDLPGSEQITLVHGDFRLDNTLITVAPELAIAAVVDWEMATIGDPLADLGLTLIYWTEPGEAYYGADATTAPGFWRRQQFIDTYAEATGRDVTGIGYYMAFAYFKLAVVLEGINARFLKNQTVGENFDREGPVVPQLIARALEVFEET
jgi:aminoglycoside phosphotransferase (APT) family kinase protein